MESTKIKYLGKDFETVLPKIIEGPMKTFIDYDCPAETYHSDKTALSSTGLSRVIVSPRHFLANWMCLESGPDDEEPDHYRFGRALHLMILEPAKFQQLYVVEPVFEGLTKDGKMSTQSKAAREKRDAWWASQSKEAIAITIDEQEKLNFMYESIMDHDVARNMFVNGKPEVSCWWKDPETGIRCKARADYIFFDPDGGYSIIDLKSTRHEEVGGFAKDIHNKRYYLRLCHYAMGFTEALGRAPNELIFVSSSKKHPFTTRTHFMVDRDIEIGHSHRRYAMALLRKSLELQQWPGPQNSIEPIHMPGYAADEELPSFEYKE